MAADYEFNTAEQWASGEHTDSHAVDPSGKLTPGVSPEILAENVSENDLAVYLRCREGTGTAIENVGSAGDGTLTPGTWKTRDDGRHYIHGGTVTVPYHASMKVATLDENDDETSSFDWAAQIRVRFSSIAAAVFMQRSNRFQLGMDATGHPYIKNYYQISRVYNNPITLDAWPQDEWLNLSSSNLVNGSVVITKDDGTSTGRTYEVDNTYGKIKFTSGGAYTGTIWVDYMHHWDSGWSELKDDTALEVDTWYTIGAVCNGGSLTLYVDRVAVATLSSNYCDNDSGEDLVAGFVGDWDAVMYSGNASSSNLVSFPSSGNWEKTIILAGDRAVRYLEMEVALADEHSISVGITFADDEDDLPYAGGWSYSSLVDGYNMIFPPEAGLYHGTKMLVKISLSQGAYDRDAVLIDYLKIHLREPATPIEEQMESPYEDLTLESVTAEDLSALIAEVQRNRVVIEDLSRSVKNLKKKAAPNLGGGGGGGEPGGGGGTPPGSGEDTPWYVDSIEQWWTATRGLEWQVSNNSGHVMRNQERLRLLDKLTATHTGEIARLTAIDSVLLTIINDVTSDLATHAADASAHHARYSDGEAQLVVIAECVAGESIDNAIDALIATHNGAAAAHDDGEGTSLYDHKILSSNVHGASEGDPLMTLADTNTAIGNHDDAADAHGSVESNYATHAADASAHHTKYTDGAVELVITAELVNGQSIDNAIDALIATHEDSGSAHGSVESNFASHKDATTGVHGVGGDHVAISTQTFDTVEDLISTHASDTTTHGTGASAIASIDDINQAISYHQNRCINYAI